MPKIIENIAKWICVTLNKTQVVQLVEKLNELLSDPETKFKQPKPELPNYRKFTVDPLKPIKCGLRKALRLNYKKIIQAKKIKPVNRKKDNKNLPPKNMRCPHCKAPSDYLYVNNGKKAKQYKCKVCGETFHTDKKERKTEYRCPYCGYALFLWKRRPLVDIYKCGNKKCSRYKEKFEKLNDYEKKLFKKKSSQFSLRYIYRKYKLSLDDIKQKLFSISEIKLARSRYSLYEIGLILTLFISLKHSSWETKETLKHVFGIKISHTHILNIVREVAKLCHNFNLKYIPKVPGYQTADETYVKVQGKQNYIWLAASKFRSIITSAIVADNRGEVPALITVNSALDKHLKNENEPFTFISDGNPSYAAAIQYMQTEYDAKIEHKEVIGLKNKDSVSAEFRFMKNIIERINRTFNHYVNNCYKNLDNLAHSVALAVTDYNFIRPHRTYDYETPIKLKELDNIILWQDKWAKIIQMATKI